ncbi:hypothetical protein V6N13_017270 [Hibiscus sabdariffa]
MSSLIAGLQLCFCATEFYAVPTKSGKVLTFGYYPYKLSSTIGQDEFSFCPAKQYGSERNLWTARLYHVLELTSRFSGIVSSNQLVYEDISICILLYGIFILAVNVESSYKICFGPKLQVKISCCIDEEVGEISTNPHGGPVIAATGTSHQEATIADDPIQGHPQGN